MGVISMQNNRRHGQRSCLKNNPPAKVWDTGNGRELVTLHGHHGYVTSVAWSPDGKRLASASADGTTQVYAMDPHLLLDLARKRIESTHRALTPDECERYFQSKTCPLLPQ